MRIQTHTQIHIYLINTFFSILLLDNLLYVKLNEKLYFLLDLLYSIFRYLVLTVFLCFVL